MKTVPIRITAAGLLAAATLAPSPARNSGVVAHEWGTFTTVAAQDGRAATWIPLGGPVDLPCFVNVFGAGDPLATLKGKVASVVVRGADGTALSYDEARAQIRATVRMETPVIYFYSPTNVVVDVTVEFPKGLVTEWYPSAHVLQPPAKADLGPVLNSVISWKGVEILPRAREAFLRGSHPSHYYPARETDAAPVRVNGENEKFLFYRGVGDFQVPVMATEDGDGNIHVRNTGADALPVVILFENRDGKVGYRVAKHLSGEIVLNRVPLSGSVNDVAAQLEKQLVETGLFRPEARAMVKTWRDSWFEEGSRLFYILPPSAVDAILPLSIKPAPANVTRTFVGRMELITRETIRRVESAIHEEDEEMLISYGRFLGPITDRALAGATAAEREWTAKYVGDLYRNYVRRMEASCK